MTAIWKVYSVIGFGDLLENLATTSMIASSVFRLETSKTISTSLDDTTRLVALGRLSSGRAELKSQSSSADAPFACWAAEIDELAAALCWGIDAAKSNIEVDAAGFCEGWLNGDPCLGTLEEEPRAAKGSEGCERPGRVGACCSNTEGAGVVDCDIGRRLLKDAKAS